jgi:hypothetical protein
MVAVMLIAFLGYPIGALFRRVVRLRDTPRRPPSSRLDSGEGASDRTP